MTLFGSYKLLKLLRLPLTGAAKFSILLVVAVLWTQMTIGVNTIWRSVPIELASLHQIGAMCVLSSLVFSMHTCRKVDVRHLKNLLGKLRVEDPKAFDQTMKNFNKGVMSKR
mmetsp:Transcript_985/g.643  ORF Transcript_985/g.643 Transcript_985/m.643 type:complete len:112 (+) Transcript_985:1030-1365(+)